MINRKKMVLTFSSILIILTSISISSKANNQNKDIKKDTKTETKIEQKISLNKLIKSDTKEYSSNLKVTPKNQVLLNRVIDFEITDYDIWKGNESVGSLDLNQKYKFNFYVKNSTRWEQIRALSAKETSITDKSENVSQGVSVDSKLEKSVDLEKGGTVSLEKLNSSGVEVKEDIKQKAYVLNVYPDSDYYNIPIRQESYTTSDGEVVKGGTLPYSADLKKWMEYDSITGIVDGKTVTYKGAGLGALKILPVSITEFNNNPTKYISKENGKYYAYMENGKFELDSIFFGNWDSYSEQDLNEASYIAVEEFSNNKPIFLGHDTVAFHRDKYFNKLVTQDKNKLFLKVDPGAAADSFESPPGDGVVNKKDDTNFIVGGENIRILKGGDFIQYPWLVASDEEIKQNASGGFGKILKVPPTHQTFSLARKSDIYIEFVPDGGKLPTDLSNIYKWEEDEYIDATDNTTNNWYLAERNGICQIQTGHSDNAATNDEKKIVANILSKYTKVSNRPPVIESFSVSNVSEKSFNARVKASDESGIQMIKFAVWREGAPGEIKWIDYKQSKPYKNSVDIEKEIFMSIPGAGADSINIGVHVWDDAGKHTFGGEYKFKLDTEVPTLKLSIPTESELPTEYKNGPVMKIEAKDNFNGIEKLRIFGDDYSEEYDLFNTGTKILNLKVQIAPQDYGNHDETLNALKSYGFTNITNVTSIPSIDEAKKYDVIIYENGAHNIPETVAKFLNSASDAGINIFTKANDTGIIESYDAYRYPIKPLKSGKLYRDSYHNLVQNGSIGQKPNRIYDNITSYINPQLYQHDIGAVDVVEMGENTRAIAIDTNDGHNAPNLLYYMNPNGTKWIHAQVFAGLEKGNGRIIDELMLEKTSNPTQYKTYMPVPKDGTYVVEIEDFFGNKTRETINVETKVPDEDLEVKINYKVTLGNGVTEKVILNQTDKKLKVEIDESKLTDFDFTIPNETNWVYARIEAEVIHPKDTIVKNNKLEVTLPINNTYKPADGNYGNLTVYPDGTRCIIKRGSTILVKAVIPYNKEFPFAYNAEDYLAYLYIDGKHIESKKVYGISNLNPGNVYFRYEIPKDYNYKNMNIQVRCDNGQQYSKTVPIKNEYSYLTYEKMSAKNIKENINPSNETDSVLQMGQKNVVAYLSVKQRVRDASRWKACQNPGVGADCNKHYYSCSSTPTSTDYHSSYTSDLYDHDPKYCPVCKTGNQKNYLNHDTARCPACKYANKWPNNTSWNNTTSHGYPNKYGCTKAYHENCTKYSNNGTNGCVLQGYWDCSKYSTYSGSYYGYTYGCRSTTKKCSLNYGYWGSGCQYVRSGNCSGCTTEWYSCGGSHYSYTDYCGSPCKNGSENCSGHRIYTSCYYDCSRRVCYTTHYEYRCSGHQVYYCGVKDAAHAWYDCPRDNEHGRGWYCPNDANHQHKYECTAYAEGGEHGLYYDWYEPDWEKSTQGWKEVYVPVDNKELKDIKETFYLTQLNFRSKYTKDNSYKNGQINSDGFTNIVNNNSLMKVKSGYGFEMEFQTTYTNTFPEAYGKHTVRNSLSKYSNDSWTQYQIIGTRNAKLPLTYKNIDSAVNSSSKPLAFASPSIHDILIDNPHELYLKFPNSEYRQVNNGVDIKSKKQIDTSSSTTYKETITYQLPYKDKTNNRKYYIDEETQNGKYEFKVFTKKVGFGVECNTLNDRLSENKTYDINVYGGYLDDIKTHLNE